MNCPTSDLRDFFFDALDPVERRQMEAHVAACDTCGAELETLRLTATALRAIPDEEIPRRIAFVSDKVFEPSPAVRWWQAFWLSGARMTAAAVALLAIAIFVHAFTRPPVAEAPRGISIATVKQSDIQPLVDKAVMQAVAASDARHEREMRETIGAFELRSAAEKRAIMTRVQDTLEAMDRHTRLNTVAWNRTPSEVGQ
jgi:hypothetical protein